MSSPFSIDELVTPLTTAEVKASIYSVITQTGVDVTLWKPGAIMRTMIAAVAIVVAALSQLVAAVARSGFLDLAAGAWLSLLAYYVYGVTRITATFATGVVTIDNAGGGAFSYAADECVFVNTTTGKEYRNTAAFTVAPLETGVDVNVRAVEAGSASSAFAGEIDAFGGPATGLSVSNALAVIGTDDEEDPPLRERCRDQLGALSPNGPADAYSAAAKGATRTDGSNVGVTRVRAVPDGLGGIDVYVATATGAVPGDVDLIDTDLGAVSDAVGRNAEPLGIASRVASATEATLNVVYELWLYNTTGLTEAQITAAIEAELLTLVKSVPIGGNKIDVLPGAIHHNAIEGAIWGAKDPQGVRLQICNVDVTTPAAHGTIPINGVIVLGTVTATAVNQVAPPGGSTA